MKILGLVADLMARAKGGGKGAGKGSLLDETAVKTKLREGLLFNSLSEDAISRVFGLMEQVSVKSGEAILREGEEGDCFFVLAKGTVSVTKLQRGKPVVVAELKDVAAFGEEALISNAKRNATVTMTADGVVLRLSKDAFTEHVKEPLLTWVSPAEAQREANEGARWLDVRDDTGPGVARLRGALVIPLQQLRESLALLDKSSSYICYCQNGRQSSTAAFLLVQRGYKVSVMRGGLQGLQRAGLL